MKKYKFCPPYAKDLVCPNPDNTGATDIGAKVELPQHEPHQDDVTDSTKVLSHH